MDKFVKLGWIKLDKNKINRQDAILMAKGRKIQFD